MSFHSLAARIVRRTLPLSAGCASLLVALTAIAAHLLPGLGDHLALQRSALLEGAWWQLLTGHLAHFGTSHLGWDVLALVVLGTMAERRSRRQWLITVLGSALLIGIGVLFMAPHILEYRGLSGIDSALFTLVGVGLMRDHAARREWLPLAGLALLVTAFMAKIAFELATGSALFVHDMGAGVIPVALAHVVGGGWGAAVALAAHPKSAQKESDHSGEWSLHAD
jgi:rhomboid family GlyGly-CTERM serine protease